jgi:aminoglycoside phosphotransferase family enzyme/predicted kinase
MDPLSLALSRPETYPHPTGIIEVVETHISRIFLTESWAYKLKKPVNLGFLDFSTLSKRRYCCREELRLNRRLCPEIYHAVVPVVQSGNGYFVGKNGKVVDYLVKMARFDRSMELDRMLAKKLLAAEHIDQLAFIVADFHKSLSPAAPQSPFGHPDLIIQTVLANFIHTEQIASDPNETALLEMLKAWTIDEHRRLLPLFLLRKKGGFIRQCHGDMHTGNMVLWNDRICIFDCIEFNENLSIIDVLSDLAFLFMDLIHGGEACLAWRLLNCYLSETGDYGALPLLRFYTVYRAMVRAKVTAIRYAQTMGENPDRDIFEQHRSYVSLARECTRRRKPMLMLTYGLSGSGKTTVSKELASKLECLHIRSDIERKRIAGMAPLEQSSGKGKNILYSESSSEKTYEKLLEMAAIALGEGIPVIADATFLDATWRARFRELAGKQHCPFRILWFHAPESLLSERIEQRLSGQRDASEADLEVLRLQLRNHDPLTPEEKTMATEIETSCPADILSLAENLTGLIR